MPVTQTVTASYAVPQSSLVSIVKELANINSIIWSTKLMEKCTEKHDILEI